jgi:hypothetical protein
MPELFNWFLTDSIGKITFYSFLVFIGIVCVLTIVFYIMAFLQGREISYWPPKIGPKPNKPKTVKPIKKTPEVVKYKHETVQPTIATVEPELDLDDYFHKLYNLSDRFREKINLKKETNGKAVSFRGIVDSINMHHIDKKPFVIIKSEKSNKPVVINLKMSKEADIYSLRKDDLIEVNGIVDTTLESSTTIHADNFKRIDIDTETTIVPTKNDDSGVKTPTKIKSDEYNLYLAEILPINIIDSNPELKKIQDNLLTELPNIGSVLNLHMTRSNPPDYKIDETYHNARIIMLNTRITKPQEWLIYLGMTISKNNKNKEGWFQLRIGNKQSKKVDIDKDDEWKIFLPAKPTYNNWYSVSVDIKNHFKDTFGKDGYVYLRLKKIRFRGEMFFSRITIAYLK